MKRNLLIIAVLIILCICSCNRSGRNSAGSDNGTINQSDDGTISLKIDNAVCYSDESDPSSNTAEWTFSIDKPGRYNVWLSSATTDTLALNYVNKVKVSLLNNRLEVEPACDKVIPNSEGVSYPFFRADSFVGSFYIQEEGEYSIQVISEKVVPKEIRQQTAYLSEPTRLMSVILEPGRR